jgi:hypothetical protein
MLEHQTPAEPDELGAKTRTIWDHAIGAAARLVRRPGYVLIADAAGASLIGRLSCVFRRLSTASRARQPELGAFTKRGCAAARLATM